MRLKLKMRKKIEKIISYNDNARLRNKKIII